MDGVAEVLPGRDGAAAVRDRLKDRDWQIFSGVQMSQRNRKQRVCDQVDCNF